MIQLYNRIWETKRRGTRKLLLLALARFAERDDPFGICWPSIDTLAEMIAESAEWTQDLIKASEQDGDIVRKVGRGRGVTTIYGLAIGLDEPARRHLTALVRHTIVRKNVRYILIGDQEHLYTSETGDQFAAWLTAAQKGVLQPPFSRGDVENPAENTTPEAPQPQALPSSPFARPARRPPAEPDHVRYLRVEGGLTTASNYANAPEPDALLADYRARRAEGQPNGAIVWYWKENGLPTKETAYRGRQSQENQPERSGGAYVAQSPIRRRPRPGDADYDYGQP